MFATAGIVLGALLVAYGFAPWRFQPGLTLSPGDVQMPLGKSSFATGRLRITNNTFEAVRLEREPGCSCLDVRFKSNYLLPLQSTECDVIVDSNAIKLGEWNLAGIRVNGRDNDLAFRFLAYLGDSK